MISLRLSLCLALSLLSPPVHSTPLDLSARDAPSISVTILPVGNALFLARVINTSPIDLNLFTYGSLLDSAPVEKLSVYTVPTSSEPAAKAPFTGILRAIRRTNLTASAFLPLAAGATFETTIDAASVYDLSNGTYSFVSQGAIPYAPAGSTILSGSAIPFTSNTLTLSVDGAAAALVPRAVPLEPRAKVQSDCTGSQLSITTTALSNCARFAQAAAGAALTGSTARFQEYFKNTDTTTRVTVAMRLSAIATQCASTDSGVVAYYCTDTRGYCKPDVVAYTLPTSNIIVNCPQYYAALPDVATACHGQDRGTTTLHEMSHASGVYSPRTEDTGYGYAAATALTAELALLNADSYAYFANAVALNC